MKFVVLTIFPEMFDPFWSHGIIRKAIEEQKISEKDPKFPRQPLALETTLKIDIRLPTTGLMAAAAGW